jgi:magnesium chelatase subunit I
VTAPFPFSAIVGQEEMKRAMLIAAVDTSVGGVLVLGDRGTGKSTAVRALAALLPQISVVQDCVYNCAPDEKASLCEQCNGKVSKKNLIKKMLIPIPVVDLPLGATEDRVVGALNLERALASGEKKFEPGLLAKANRGFLYVDEVNLLEDHIVDLLIDVAASGQNLVEREGLSVRHPAQFVLVGSGNPEEGELRPQLLDRFGLSVEVKTPTELQQRIEVVRRRDAYERDPFNFFQVWETENEKVRRQVIRARSLLPKITISESILSSAAQLCMALGTDGLRGELTLIRAARALAALQGQKVVASSHLQEVAVSALRHRLRRDPLDETGSTARVEKAVSQLFNMAPVDT